MVYRRYPYLHRTYYQTEPKPSNEKEKSFEDIKMLDDIPMPNERESLNNPEVSTASGSERSFLEPKGLRFYLDKFLPLKLNLEDLIILGIIVVLLYEGRKDDILIVVLIYLLL